MKRKKLLAIVLATTMVAGSSMTTLAAVGSLSGNDGTVSGGGDVSYVDKTVYSVGVPTSQSLTLVVDPQGLTDLKPGESINDDVADSKAGKITCVSKMPLLNQSSVDIVADVKLQLTGNATPVTTEALVNTGTDENVLLYAAPTSTGITKKADVDTQYTAPKKGIVMDKTTPSDISFVLPKATDYATHNVSGALTYKKADSDLGNGTAIAFGGWVNKNADWTAYAGDSPTKTIGMTVVYKFKDLTNEVAETPADSAYMVSYSGNKVDVPANSDVPGALTFAKQGNGDYTCTITGAAASAPTALTINGEDRSGALPMGKVIYDTSSKLFTLKADLVPIVNLPSGTHTVVVTIGGTPHTIKLTKV